MIAFWGIVFSTRCCTRAATYVFSILSSPIPALKMGGFRGSRWLLPMMQLPAYVRVAATVLRVANVGGERAETQREIESRRGNAAPKPNTNL